MRLFNSYFPYIDCDIEGSGVSVGPDGVPIGATVEAHPGGPGCYLLIENHLVPGAFIDRLVEQVGTGTRLVSYGPVLSPREMCGEEFWGTLGANERQVIGHCLLMLIECGCIDVAYDGETC